MFNASANWKSTYPEAAVGVLAMRNVTNPPQHAPLQEAKQALERELRTTFADHDRTQLRQLPLLAAYHSYYKQFKKTYHVQHQLESVVFKDRSIPHVAALVEAMFMAELKNLLLTAGHDLDVVQPPVSVDVAEGHEQYVRINGQEQVLKEGDMFIADTQGILSSIIYGPDQRTQITGETTRVLFTVYGPPGIDAQVLENHLGDIRANVELIAPQAEVEALKVLTAVS
jgi:DNA/RNA-binding domain of Phe-tRNA-synthetase-like protein